MPDAAPPEPAARGGEPEAAALDGYERGTVVTMPLDRTTAIPFRQERDRCYAVVLSVLPGSTLSKRVRREGVIVGDGSFDLEERVTMHEHGGTARFCPLTAARKPLQIYYVMPVDRRLGSGQLAVEVWSKKMPPEWVREERENRRIADRYLRSQAPKKDNPACARCTEAFDACRLRGRTGDDDFQCGRALSSCQSANRCW